MRFYLKNVLLICFLLSSFFAQATHIRAGEIIIEQLEDCGLTIRATVVTYAKASMNAADEDSVTVEWGDGSMSFAARINGPGNKGELIGNDIRLNKYEVYHTYAARSTYKISTTDLNRNDGIVNIPNSVFIPMYIWTTYTFLNPQFQGCNSTPVMLQPPIDFGCVGKKFTHNPNAYDPDGDSLAYVLTTPLYGENVPVLGYVYPNQINPGPNNTLSLDSETGEFVWNTPQQAGEYNIAILVIEYRNGVAIDTTMRDMQILIETCDNEPPTVQTNNDTCVVAGTLLNFGVVATDVDLPIQQLQLLALGGPLLLEVSPATFTAPIDYADQPVQGQFEWQTTCEHISDQYYSVIFKAKDDYFGNSGLSALKQIRIKIVGPPPLDVTAIPDDNDQIVLSWVSPYACEAAEEDYFRTFTVWRKEGSNQFPLDTCAPGLAGKGYTKISPDTKEMDAGRYTFIDGNIQKGRTYCYRVLAEFAKISAGGHPYNIVESLPSNEACVQLGRDIPLLTKVSVTNTDNTNGSIQIEWTKPLSADLDTLQNPGDYTYEVLQETGMVAAPNTAIYTTTSPSFAQANDTTYHQNNLNTIANPFSYRIAFYVKGASTPLGYASPAASIFLSAAPSDKKVNLSWQEMVPWDNFSYTIYRENLTTGIFDSIGTTTDLSYSDEGLENNQEYCYFIRSFGSYGVTDIYSPLINDSQEACATPKDDVPPCHPMLTVNNVCLDNNIIDLAGNFYNLLSWTHPASICGDMDVAGFNIYYTPTQGGDLTIIETITDTSYSHYPDLGIAGCYAVTAFDIIGNESSIDSITCVDNCPIYELPNAFTPNGDGQNDVFIPYPYHFIAEIDMQIYNQWGNLVFTTKEPDINWDGTTSNGVELPTGTYFYTCTVVENRVSGLVKQGDVLKGFIELVR